MKKVYILIAIIVVVLGLVFLIPKIGSGKHNGDSNVLDNKTKTEQEVKDGYNNVKVTRNTKDSKLVQDKKIDDDGEVVDEGVDVDNEDNADDDISVMNEENIGDGENVDSDSDNMITNDGDNMDVVNGDNLIKDVVWEMKLVNEDTSSEELRQIKNLGVGVVSGEWGMGDGDVEDVRVFLDKVYQAGLKIEINFGDGSAWGYAEDGTDTEDQAPVWQAEEVAEFIIGIRDKPAILRYNISNEAGENLPNYPDYRIKLDQVRQASQTVRQADPARQVSLRTRYWDADDRRAIGGDTNWIPLASGLVDVVVLNLYSNYADDGVHPNTSDMVHNSGKDLVERILAIDPNVQVVIALAAYREDLYFIKPSVQELKRDIEAAIEIVQDVPGAIGISFFGWGPERYPMEGKGWYMLEEGKDLMGVIVGYSR